MCSRSRSTLVAIEICVNVKDFKLTLSTNKDIDKS